MITLSIYFQYLYMLRILRMFVVIVGYCLSQESPCVYFAYKRNNCLSVSAFFMFYIYCLLNICISIHFESSTSPPAVSEFSENAVCKSIKTVWPCDICFALLCGEFSIDQFPNRKTLAFTYVIIMQRYHSTTEGF